MRLTLRTLLAWLDGVVPSGETEDLARKIAGSTAAGTVIDRIQAVVASPAIDASRADARGLGGDANTVAEYLTNALPADSVAAFERVCIESDAQLAEVAACHRMLAEVAAAPSILEDAPADLVARLRARVGARVGATSSALGRAGDRERAGEHAGEHDSETASAGSRPVPTTRLLPADGSRLLPYVSLVAAVALLVLLGAGLGWSVWRSAADGDVRATAARPAEHRTMEPPIVEPEAAAPAAVDAVVAPAPSRDERSDPTPTGERQEPAQASPPPQATNPPPTAAAPTVAAPTVPAPAVAAPGVSAPAVERVPGGEALAIAAVPARVAPTPAPAPDAPLPPDGPIERPAGEPDARGNGADSPPAFVVGPAPLLIRRAAALSDAEPQGTPEAATQGATQGAATDAAEWEAVAPEKGFSDRQDLLVPPGFSPTLAIGSATLQVDGATRIVVSPPSRQDSQEPEPQKPDSQKEDASGIQRLEVVFGRVMLTGVDAATPIVILAGGLVGRAAGEGGAPILIEVRLSREPGAIAAGAGGDGEQAVVPTSVRSIVSFPKGGTWQPDDPSSPSPEGLGGDGAVPAGAAVVFDGVQGAAGIESGHARVERGPSATISFAGSFAGRASGELLTRTSCEALAAAAASGRPLEEVIESLLADGRAENRAAAAATLALLGDYGPLVQVLAAEEPGRRLPGSQWDALARSTVPLALARGARSAGRFRRAVEQELPGEAAATVVRLAEGFSDRDLADGGDGLLVRSLEHPSLVVRRFAAATLFDTVRPSDGDRLRFRPDAAEAARAEGVKWWRIQLEKGLIRRTPAGGLSKPADE